MLLFKSHSILSYFIAEILSVDAVFASSGDARQRGRANKESLENGQKPRLSHTPPAMLPLAYGSGHKKTWYKRKKTRDKHRRNGHGISVPKMNVTGLSQMASFLTQLILED